MGPELPENSNHMSVHRHSDTNPDSLLDTSATQQRPAQSKKIAHYNNFISDMAEYILTNDGPDKKGYAHPTPKRIRFEFLEEALDKAYRAGLSQEWRPYHFQGHVGTYSREQYVNELVVKKTEQVLTEQFNGELTTLLTQIKAKELFSPLKDQIGDRTIQVPIQYVSKKFEESPYLFLLKYLELKGLDKDYNLKPYHMSHMPRDSSKDESLLKEIILKKGEQLLAQTKFKNDPFLLVTTLTNEDMHQPFMDLLGGKNIPVSTRTIMDVLGDSPFRFAKKLIEVKGLSELSGLRPYHMQSRAQRGAFEDQEIVDEVIIKVLDSLLGSDKYQGDVLKLLTEASMDELALSHIDHLAGREIEVSLARVASLHYYDRYSILMHYRDLKGYDEFKDLKPYHLKPRMSRGALEDKQLRDEFVGKLINNLLNSPKYGGDFNKFCNTVILSELIQPFPDRIGSHVITVSPRALLMRFNDSPTQLLTYYKQNVAKLG